MERQQAPRSREETPDPHLSQDLEDPHAQIARVMASPEMQRLGRETEAEELRLGTALSGMYRPQAERWARALREADTTVLSRICPGKHGHYGRICVLDAGHERDGNPHWGKNKAGRPVAWLGSAPDDD
ncbi:hypothetical protein SMD44_p10150 (plasmid) [Streptomyces alboflavus]|uniref:Uncharacterized protein n=1 Tax=Streptomyces alboflavus TaxID=67267 RepID=A0A291W4Z5_9ACTN|nr:hypothetical protein [Streptomyces alboflavus]ATM24649.1 hypothetical protein SMD44_p10150 [Streptomyces alboflavus]